ncbi:hypothetical protein [Caulobacter hibisci]|uniref:Spore coat protein U domain-containing protein n=1 Tax=Caulobacter hibisci TaxID=2035993 RepID=A0ABS0SXI0_9CAUL|nr:hypothetical protein [Caulobacter hibisci]MBI1684319.1 hypothetical protein [Caulobacter hibisci]
MTKANRIKAAALAGASAVTLLLLGQIARAQTDDNTRDFVVQGQAPKICTIATPTLGAGQLVNFLTLTGGTLQVDQLTDPTTLSTRAASAEVTFAAVCNYAHQIVLESQNNGLWRSELGLTPTPTGFSDAVPYTATLAWGPVNNRFEADASARQIRDSAQAVDQPVAGDVTLRLDIQPGATNLQTNAPLVSGVYRDTLRLTVEPQ